MVLPIHQIQERSEFYSMSSHNMTTINNYIKTMEYERYINKHKLTKDERKEIDHNIQGYRLFRKFERKRIKMLEFAMLQSHKIENRVDIKEYDKLYKRKMRAIGKYKTKLVSEMTPEEAELSRLKAREYYHKRKSNMTPEQLEIQRLRHRDYYRRNVDYMRKKSNQYYHTVTKLNKLKGKKNDDKTTN